jgi:murein DD-endopeptidase MepM/ murein hydrolase activator NlpD
VTGVKTLSALAAAFLLFLAAATSAGAGRPNVAALQVALEARGLYAGTIDGVIGPATGRAVRRLQRRAHITVDGIPGPQTRRALGRYGRKRYGHRMLAMNRHGWDVAALQFALAAHGFPSGTFDGYFGWHSDSALRHFQRWARIGADGVAGPATYAALRRRPARCRLTLRRPLRAPVGDRFGPRGRGFHPGVDFPAAYGTRVRAAASGRVVFAGWDAGGYGYLVTVRHRHHVRMMYAHLSHIAVRVGERVRSGRWVGNVGASGEATGPHLHFEVRINGSPVDPLGYL